MSIISYLTSLVGKKWKFCVAVATYVISDISIKKDSQESAIWCIWVFSKYDLSEPDDYKSKPNSQCQHEQS